MNQRITSDALITADPDRDGFTNGQEFAHGSNPNNPNSRPEFRLAVSGSASLTFLRRAGGIMAGGTYTMDGFALEALYSTDLIDWQVTTLEGAVPPGLPTPPSGYEYVSFLLPPAVFASADEAFMQVRVSGP